MKFGKVLENTVNTLAKIRMLGRDPKLGKLDLAVLSVALMIAALDGKVLKSEIESFLALARKCRGANAKSIKEAYDQALRAAGYISIIVQTEDEKKALAAFTDEVVKVMPEDFLMANPEDVRRAFVIWTAIAMGDGDYSDIERKAIDMLVKRFTVIKSAIFQDKLDRAMALSPAFRVAYDKPQDRKATVRLLPDGFLAEVEKKLARSGDVDIAELIRG